jgi:F0F1-type ATP synthase delta subunit
MNGPKKIRLDKLIETLEDYGTSAPIITITLAAPAPNSLKKTLIDWCRKNIAPNALIDFRFNATMLGGMVVQYGSRIYDWSFRRQILAARDKFPEILRNV